MALDLIVLGAAVPKLLEAVQASLAKLREIRSGFRAQNDEAKKELADKLTEVEAQLRDVGKLARSAEEYFRVRESLGELLAECKEVENSLTQSLDDAKNRASALYLATWQNLATMYDRIDAARVVPRQVLTDRADFYDQRDTDQVTGFINGFDAAFNEARGYINVKNAQAYLAQIKLMIRSLRDADQVLQTRAYGTILRSLAGLAQEH